MRVLLLNYEYPPYGGGAGVATEALARTLASRGVTVDVVTAGDRSECETELLWDGDAAEEGLLNVHRVRCRRTSVHQASMRDAGSYLRAALPVIRRLLRAAEYDAVHFYFSLPTGALIPFLNLGKTPVIVSLRGSDVPGYDSHNRNLEWAHAVLRPFTRWIWRRADRVVPVCESLGRMALRTLPELDYTVIPNGVDLQRFHPPASRRARRSGPVRCIAVARLVERKGVADLIRAIGSLERGSYELEIVGTGPDEHLLRELVASLRLDGLVKFSGSLDRATVARRYRDADLFTLASVEEAFGNVFAEAMASGLPIVGSAVGGIPDLVQHCRNGLLVPPRDPFSLAAAIRHLGENPALRVEIGNRNRAQAEATLSWDRITTRYLSLYNGLRRRSPARSRLAEVPSSSW
jgi:glycosyltransferase involved in cell wall biosynthesis